MHIQLFEGGDALSGFRARQLLARMQRIRDDIAGVSARKASSR